MPFEKYVLAFAAIFLTGWAAMAQAPVTDYPSKPIKMIVPFAAGGSTDYIARVIGNYIERKTGQATIVENRPGAGGTISMEALTKSPADGYTLATVSTGELVVNRYLYKRLSFDPLRDILPVAMLGRSPQVLAINANVPVRTLAEFIAYAKANPGKISYASPGVGSISHLGGYMLAKLASLDLVHVPYRGSAPAMTDLLANRVQMLHIALQPIIQHARKGTLRILAVAAPSRMSEYIPDIPSSTEAGLPEYQMELWWGLVAPRGTPKATIERLNAMMRDLVAEPEYRARITDAYLIPVSMATEEFATHVADEAPKWEHLIKDMGLTLN